VIPPETRNTLRYSFDYLKVMTLSINVRELRISKVESLRVSLIPVCRNPPKFQPMNHARTVAQHIGFFSVPANCFPPCSNNEGHRSLPKYPTQQITSCFTCQDLCKSISNVGCALDPCNAHISCSLSFSRSMPCN